MPSVRQREAGTATAEFAVALPALVLVLGIALGGLGLGLDEVRCIDAARSAVRLLARGESLADVRAEAVRAGPDGAAVSIDATGTTVAVTVTGHLPGTLADLGLPRPSSTAVAARETP